MARVKRGATRHKRHKKVVEQAKGYWGRKKNVFSRAQEQVMKSGQYAFRDRRARKRDFRRLWIVRLSAACRECGVRYGEFIHALTEQGVQVNRKMLSELAIEDMGAFRSLVEKVTAARKKVVSPSPAIGDP
jgi:large subunit ribosomal protein L20